MRPLTDHLPKPLIMVGGKPLLTHIIKKLDDTGITRIVINGHHKVEKLRDYIPQIRSAFPHIDFALSVEEDLLETGGGLINALPLLDKTRPLYMINGDAYWVDGDKNTLQSLWEAFYKKNNDLTLLLQHINTMPLTEAKGDYTIGSRDQAIRSLTKTGTHMFTGIRILHPRILADYAVRPFSFLDIMDDTESKGTLGGLHHTGQWYHISTPKDLDDVNTALFAEAS